MTETLDIDLDPVTAAEPILEVRDLTVTFPNPKGDVHAVRGVNYEVKPGEFLGIVGESGSGKSVSSMAVMGLLPSTAQIAGSIRYRGQSLLDMNDHQMSKLRGREIAMVFQDPLSALTPVFTIGEQISEGLIIHDPSLSKEAANDRAIELLKIVGIPGAERRVKSYPHEFSGGMRQRAMIAIAIANDPDLIIADEPTTALDVTIQAQILDVLQKAREITGAAIVLITHDLGVVAGNADRIAVMYAGRLVETGEWNRSSTARRCPTRQGCCGQCRTWRPQGPNDSYRSRANRRRCRTWRRDVHSHRAARSRSTSAARSNPNSASTESPGCWPPATVPMRSRGAIWKPRTSTLAPTRWRLG